ncbi:hypothetical protein K435DRAFT_189244 [Dendrothele bispora CBS 962.96]|uniref:Uncharacterized protein n=1 Tax=Dendrothele bispora (strain CBS 962.96) TaxID=1314807 RepID=A0A4S8LVD8_DENBC|nr:hypothetical protein K435DRAFT_189244 [Dendrothele bispora CBS 962.96]
MVDELLTYVGQLHYIIYTGEKRTCQWVGSSTLITHSRRVYLWICTGWYRKEYPVQ